MTNLTSNFISAAAAYFRPAFLLRRIAAAAIVAVVAGAMLPASAQAQNTSLASLGLFVGEELTLTPAPFTTATAAYTAPALTTGGFITVVATYVDGVASTNTFLVNDVAPPFTFPNTALGGPSFSFPAGDAVLKVVVPLTAGGEEIYAVTFTASTVTPPAKAANVTVADVTATGFTANWGAVDTADTYEVQLIQTGNEFQFPQENPKGITGTSQIFAGLNGYLDVNDDLIKRYSFRVRAVNAGGNGDWSDTVDIDLNDYVASLTGLIAGRIAAGDDVATNPNQITLDPGFDTATTSYTASSELPTTGSGTNGVFNNEDTTLYLRLTAEGNATIGLVATNIASGVGSAAAPANVPSGSAFNGNISTEVDAVVTFTITVSAVKGGASATYTLAVTTLEARGLSDDSSVASISLQLSTSADFNDSDPQPIFALAKQTDGSFTGLVAEKTDGSNAQEGIGTSYATYRPIVVTTNAEAKSVNQNAAGNFVKDGAMFTLDTAQLQFNNALVDLTVTAQNNTASTTRFTFISVIPPRLGGIFGTALTVNSANVEWAQEQKVNLNPADALFGIDFGYDVEYRTASSPSDWTVSEMVSVDEAADVERNVTLTGLTPGTNYLARIRATSDHFDVNFAGTWSVVGSFSTQDTVALVPPTELAVTSGDTQAEVTWTPNPDTAVTGYRLRWAVEGTTDYLNIGEANGVEIAGRSTKSRIITSLTNDTEYRVSIAAETADAVSTFTAGQLVTPMMQLHPAPGNVSVVAGDEQITANWNAVADATAGYQIRWRADSGVVWNANDGVTTDDATSHVINGLANGTAYVVQVRAVNGEWSTTSAVVTPLFPAPTGLTLTAGDDAASTANWSAPTRLAGTTGTISGYVIEWKVAGGSVVSSASTSATTQTNSNLANGTAYTARVRAENGEWSADSAQAIPLFPAPNGLMLTAGPASITANWTAPTTSGSITAYEARRRTSPSGQFQTSPAIATTSPTHTFAGLINGTLYEVQVRALNGKWTSGHTATPASTLAELRGLSLAGASAGTHELDQTFDSNTLTYTATVAGTVKAVRIFADDNLDSTRTDLTLPNGITDELNQSTPYALNVGENVFTITVIAQNGVNMRAYTLTITREGAPNAPSISEVTAGESTLSGGAALAVTWTEPSGGSPVVNYRIRWGKGASGSTPIWNPDENGIANKDGIKLADNAALRTHTISDLDVSTSYGVSVAAENENGIGAWSPTNFTETAVAADDSRIIGLTVTTGNGAEIIVLTQSDGSTTGFVATDIAYTGEVAFGGGSAILTPSFAGAAKVDLYLDDTTTPIVQSVTASGTAFAAIDVAVGEEVVIVLVATATDDNTTTEYTITLTGAAGTPTAGGSAPALTTPTDAAGELDVRWTWDGATNGNTVAGFRVEYRKTVMTGPAQPLWLMADVGGNTSATSGPLPERSAVGSTLTGLDAGVAYDVRYAARVTSPGLVIGEYSEIATARASGPPDAPTITLTDAVGAINVAITAPDFTGGPPVNAYFVRWRTAAAVPGDGSEGAWQAEAGAADAGQNIGADISAAYVIADLLGGQNYDVEVRAGNKFVAPNGRSAWVSDSGNPDKANLVITADDATKVYGADDPAFTYTARGYATVGGVTDTATIFDEVPFTRTGLGNAAGENVGELAFTLKNPVPFAKEAVRGRYNVTLASGNKLTITPKEVTYESTTANKVYDATTAAPTNLGGSFSGAVNRSVNSVAIDDTVTGQLTLSGGAFTDKTADTGKDVTGDVTAFVLGGAASSNYTLGTVSIEGDIAPRVIASYFVVVPDRVYDATINVPAFDATATDSRATTDGHILGSDEVTIDASAAAIASGNVGDQTVTGYAATGADSANYSITFTANLTITKRPLRITAAGSGNDLPTGTTLTDHSLLTAGSAAGEGLVGSDTTLAGVLMGGIVVGTEVDGVFALDQGSLALNANAGANYQLFYNTAGSSFTQTAADKAVVRIVPDTATKVYGAEDAAFTYTLVLDRGAFADTAHSETTLSTFFSAVPFARAAGEDVGADYAYSPKAPLPLRTGIADSYDFIVDTTARFTITPKPVTYTSAVADKVYDSTAAAPAFADLGGGFATGDLVNAVVNGVTIDDTAADKISTSGGVYPAKSVDTNLTVSGLALAGTAASNYAATFDVTGAITKFATTYTVLLNDRVYDGTSDVPAVNPQSAFSPPLFGSDVVTIDPARASISGGPGIGDYTPTGYAATGTDAGNYEITYAGDFSITKRPLSVTAGGSGAADPDGMDYNLLTATGLVDPTVLADVLTGVFGVGDAMEITLLNGAKFALTRGTIALNAGAGANYELTFNDGQYTRTEQGKATLVVTPAVTEKVYGANDPDYVGIAVSVAPKIGSQFISGSGHSTTTTKFFSDGAAVVKRDVTEQNVGEYAYQLVDSLPFDNMDFATQYNFVIDSNARFNITPKPVTYTTDAADKVYDALLDAPAFADIGVGGGFSGVLAGGSNADGLDIDDTGKLTLSGGVFRNKNVGEGKTTSGWTLGGEAAANYSLSSATISGDITAVAATAILAFDPDPRVYDDTTDVPTASFLFSPALESDVLTIVQDSVATTSANVGTYAIVDSEITGLSIGGADADNYDITLSGGFVISKRPLTVTSATSGDKVPVGTDYSLLTVEEGEGVGLVLMHALDDVLTGAFGVAEPASDGDPYVLTQGGLLANAGIGENYMLVFNGSNYIQTTPDKPTLAITPDVISKVYGADDPDYTSAGYKVTLARGNYVSPHDENTVFFTAGAQVYMRDLTSQNVGAYPFELADTLPFTAGISLDDYDVIFADNALFRITPKPVTYTATADKEYDGTAAAPTTDFGGAFADGDLVVADVNGVSINDTAKVSVSGGTYADANVDAGGTAIVISGFALSGDAAGNYSLAAESSVTGNITPKALTVANFTLSREYNGLATIVGAEISSGGAISGAVTGQGFTLAVMNAADAAFPGGANVVSGETLKDLDSSDFVLIGDAASIPANYSFDVSGLDITADITAKVVTVAAITAEKVYDGTAAVTVDQLSGGAVSGVIAPQSFTLDISVTGGGASGSFASSVDVDTNIIVTGFEFALNGDGAASIATNYTLPDITILGAITPAELTAPDGLVISKVFDNTADMVDTTTDPAIPVVLANVSGTLTGAVDGQNFTLTLDPASSGVFDDVNAADPVTISGVAVADLQLQGQGGAMPGNYTLASDIAITGRIDKRPVSIGRTTVTRVYDGGTDTAGVTLVGSVGAVSGVIEGTGVTLTADIASDPSGGVFTSKDVADGITIRNPSAVFDVTSSDGGDNYEIDENVTLVGNITARDVTVDTANLTYLKSYDGTNATGDSRIAPQHVTGIVDGENVVVGLATGLWASSARGTAINISNIAFELRSDDDDAAVLTTNYNLATNLSSITTGAGEITARTLTLTLAGAQPGSPKFVKSYDGKTNLPDGVDVSFTAAVGEIVSGETVVAVAGTFNSPDVADATHITVTLTGGDAANYAVEPFPATILRKLLGVTATGASKIYDGTLAAPTGISATLSNDTVAGNHIIFGDGDDVMVVFGDYNSANVADADTIGITLAQDPSGDGDNSRDVSANYTLSPATVTAGITTRPLRITAASLTASTPPAVEDLAYSVDTGIDGEGLVAPDVAEDVLEGDLAYGAINPDGTTPIEQGSLAVIADGNYHIPADGFTAGVFTPGTSRYDVDESGEADGIDGILIARYLIGLRGNLLVTGLTDALPDAATVANNMSLGLNDATEGDIFDVDGDTDSDVHDGVMIARYLHGVLSGPGLTAGNIAAGDTATQTTVEANLQKFAPKQPQQ